MRAVQKCLDLVDFGDVLIFSDQFNELRVPGAQHIRATDWPDKLGYSNCNWFDMPRFIKTKHSLNIQWDSHIIDASKWKNIFLRYDYIGAPWWFPALNVGNGGFNLRSKRLTDFVLLNQDKIKFNEPADDNIISRQYRPSLEEAGFNWAPVHLAWDFAYECVKPDPWGGHFGFHGAFNFPRVYDKVEYGEVKRIMQNTPHLKNTQHIAAMEAQELAMKEEQTNVRVAPGVAAIASPDAGGATKTA